MKVYTIPVAAMLVIGLAGGCAATTVEKPDVAEKTNVNFGISQPIGATFGESHSESHSYYDEETGTYVTEGWSTGYGVSNGK